MEKTKNIGNILLPDQYYDDDEEMLFSDSLSARAQFIQMVDSEDFVVKVASMALSNGDKILVWMYVDEFSCTVKAVLPLFKETTLPQGDVFSLGFYELTEGEVFTFKKERYAVALTSNAVIVVRRLRLVLETNLVLNILKIDKSDLKYPIYPVEMYDKKTGEYVCLSWLVTRSSTEMISTCLVNLEDDEKVREKLTTTGLRTEPLPEDKHVEIHGKMYHLRFYIDGAYFVPDNIDEIMAYFNT